MKVKGRHSMKNMIMTLTQINALAVSAVAGHSIIDFVRQMSDGVLGTFTSDCYSTGKTGAGKMSWFPAPACWIDSPHSSRACKVWAIVPLRRIEQNSTLAVYKEAADSVSIPISRRYCGIKCHVWLLQ